MTGIKGNGRKWPVRILLTLEMLSVQFCARASPLRDCMPDGWTEEYRNLLPWIKRISVLLIVTGAVKMAEGYGKNGVYGMTGGAVHMIAGGILYAVCV